MDSSNLKLKHLKSHIYEKVTIYTSKDGDWDELEDIYRGEMQDIPDVLLECTVGVIGATKKGIIDISIKPN